ncbi:MAG: DNA recombination protein RmuC [Candidatus Paceibacterota bacterium]|jgi:DNA recombination protein RmuC
MFEQIITNIITAIIVLGALFLLLKRPLMGYLKRIADENLKSLEERNRELLKEERDRFMELQGEKMKRNEQYLDGKKDVIKELVEKINSELSESQKKIENTEKERISEFSNLRAILEEHKDVTTKLKDSTDNLKNILSNNQLRGKYGEEVAENILKMIGFVKDLDYVVNLAQDTNANRPDITIKLPDKTKINIDAKFPYQSLVKYQEVDDKLEKKKYLDQFKTDVKQKIKQVTSRDYINPEEKTMDFVILFVPNEMIFSLICDKLSDISGDALRKKVIITGPFSFAAISRMIRQSYDNFRIQEDLHKIIGYISKFKQEFSKYNEEVDRLGSRIRSVSEQYDAVSGVRTRQLQKIVDQIGGEKIENGKDNASKLIE